METTILEKGVGGISLLTLLFGFVGACLGISYMPPMTKREQIFALLSGLACSALGPALLGWWLDRAIPVPVSSGIGFLLGILGMFIIPGVIIFGQSFRSNPFFVIDWLRGRGAPPPTEGK